MASDEDDEELAALRKQRAARLGVGGMTVVSFLQRHGCSTGIVSLVVVDRAHIPQKFEYGYWGDSMCLFMTGATRWDILLHLGHITVCFIPRVPSFPLLTVGLWF
jgi:hypothetical protein